MAGGLVWEDPWGGLSGLWGPHADVPALPPPWLSEACDKLIAHGGEGPSAAEGGGRAPDVESDQYII